jgi:TolA-binding protein
LEQQPSDKEKITTKVTTSYDNKNSVAVKPNTQNEQTAISEDKVTTIKNLEKKNGQLQEEIKYLRDGSSAQRQRQQQQQQEETFAAIGCLELQNNDVPIRVTVNVKTKTIECMEIAYEVIKGY